MTDSSDFDQPESGTPSSPDSAVQSPMSTTPPGFGQQGPAIPQFGTGFQQGPPFQQGPGYQLYGGGYQPQIVNPFDQQATPVLVLGILGVLFCPLTAPFAWVMGNKLRDEAVAARWPEPGLGKLGRILGIVGSFILATYGIMMFFGLVIMAFSAGVSN